MNVIKFIFFGLIFFTSCILMAIDDPCIQIKETSENVLKMVYSNSQNTEEEILAYLSDNYNLDIIIRRTLGRNWKKIKPEHQSKVITLIKHLVLRAYIDGLRGREVPDIKYKDTKYISSKRAEVPTFIYFSGKPINLTYRLGLVSDRWEIFDISVENISIVLTYRIQFDMFLANNSSDALVKKLETLLTNENLGKELPL